MLSYFHNLKNKKERLKKKKNITVYSQSGVGEGVLKADLKRPLNALSFKVGKAVGSVCTQNL